MVSVFARRNKAVEMLAVHLVALQLVLVGL